MRWTPVLTIALLASLAFAGCAGTSDDTSSSSTADATSSSTTTTRTTTSTAPTTTSSTTTSTTTTTTSTPTSTTTTSPTNSTNTTTEHTTATLTGHITAPDPIAAADQGCFLAIFTLLGTPEEAGGIYELPDGVEAGWTYAVDASDVMVEFYDADSAFISGGPSGSVPDGAVEVFVCGVGPGAVDVDWTVTFTSP